MLPSMIWDVEIVVTRPCPVPLPGGALMVLQLLLCLAFGGCAFAAFRSARRMTRKNVDVEEGPVPEGYGETKEIRL